MKSALIFHELRAHAPFTALGALAGIALLWRAPVGPISISYAIPLRSEPDDEIEHLQFTFGGSF